MKILKKMTVANLTAILDTKLELSRMGCKPTKIKMNFNTKEGYTELLGGINRSSFYGMEIIIDEDLDYGIVDIVQD